MGDYNGEPLKFRFKEDQLEKLEKLEQLESMYNYKSPIEMIATEFQTKYEKDCVSVCRRYGFNVDKDELAKALAYDRNQYDKGFKDGYAQAIKDRQELYESNNDLTSREALRNYARKVLCADSVTNTSLIRMFDAIIDNAPTVEINTNDIEHKAYCKGLEDGKKIARPQEDILDVIHNTIYGFMDLRYKEEPMSDKDKLLLEVNKAICNRLRRKKNEKEC